MFRLFEIFIVHIDSIFISLDDNLIILRISEFELATHAEIVTHNFSVYDANYRKMVLLSYQFNLLCHTKLFIAVI